ncbi:hypothetical protein P4S72_14185 [Vibrio sp. PP-XX7]
MDQKDVLNSAISQLESASTNFAYRYINDSRVRASYIHQTKQLSQEYKSKVKSGVISPEEAAKQVKSLRNEILQAQRLRSSDIGRATAVNLKKQD